MKTEIVIGDTLDFETSVPDYPNTDGWTLTFRLIPITSGSAITFSASGTPVDDPLGYRVQLAPATTAAWTAGDYAWNSYLVKSGARQTLESGQVTLLPDPAVATAPRDNRSHSRICLDNIEAVLEGRSSKDQDEFQIAGRMLKRTPFAELRKARDYYRAEVAREDAAERLANGEVPKSKVVVRL